MREPSDLAAWAHCEFLKISPYPSHNKQLARALMNSILIPNHRDPIVFKSTLEQLAYHSCVFDTLKSGRTHSFERLVADKISLSPSGREFEAYLVSEYINPNQLAEMKSIFNPSPKNTSKSASPPVSFFKSRPPAVNYKILGPNRHVKQTQQHYGPDLDEIIAQLALDTVVTKGATKFGWLIYYTDKEGCFAARITFAIKEHRQEFKRRMQGVLPAMFNVKSNDGNFTLRINFHSDTQLMLPGLRNE